MSSVPANDRCANCGAERKGSFCQTCGQRHRDERLTIRRFMRDLVARLFDLESGLLHTAWRLTVAPGTVPRDFVQERRKRYVGPGTYLIIVATLSILLFTLVEDTYARFIQETLAQTIADSQSESAAGDLDPEALAATLTHWLNQGTVYLSLFMAGMFAVLVRWVVPGWRQRYNVAETCVFGVYTTAHGFLLSLPLYGLLVAIPFTITGMMTVSWLMMALVTGYVALAARQFLDRRWTTVVMTWMTSLATYLLFSLIGTVLGFAIAVLSAG